MSNDISPPIQITDSTTLGLVATFARYAVSSLGGYALGKGWIDNDLLQVLLGLVTLGIPTAYGLYKNWVHKTQLITVGRAAPDAVATVTK